MLTDQWLDSLVALDKPIKPFDGGGLHIVVVPPGRKRWRLAYRLDGKQKTVDGGEYSAVSLHRARVWREEIRSLLAVGADSIAHKKEAKFQAVADKVTFEMLAREWIEFEGLGSDEPTPGRMKMRSEHLVPLPPQAVDLLRRIRNNNPYGKATVHGSRSLASTVLNETGHFMPDWIEMQLAHMPRGVRGVHNAARYLSHRRKMMKW